jgi:poly(A) polymerase
VSELRPDWLTEPTVQHLLAALAAGGVEARFVGGCVRDALLGIETGDIDLATPARPEAVIAALETAKIKAVPTGLEHGTVTAEIPPRTFEITTLRRDVETDGRHAVVAFDAGWAEDAARRDFTINAIYLAPDGSLFDPVGGRADLAARRVCFIGEPETRVAQDLLRVLRYYRFEARFGGGNGDAAARTACHAAANKLPLLSAERRWRELSGLLATDDVVRVLRLMMKDGVLRVLLPAATRLDRLQRFIDLAEHCVDPRGVIPNAGKTNKPSPRDLLLRLEALTDFRKTSANAVADRLKLPSADRKRLRQFSAVWSALNRHDDAHEMRTHLFLFGGDYSRDVPLIAAAERRVSAKKRSELLDLAKEQPHYFPLNGDDVTDLGINTGPQVGELLSKVRRWWAEQGFVPNRDSCLERLRSEVGRNTIDSNIPD